MVLNLLGTIQSPLFSTEGECKPFIFFINNKILNEPSKWSDRFLNCVQTFLGITEDVRGVLHKKTNLRFQEQLNKIDSQMPKKFEYQVDFDNDFESI